MKKITCIFLFFCCLVTMNACNEDDVSPDEAPPSVELDALEVLVAIPENRVAASNEFAFQLLRQLELPSESAADFAPPKENVFVSPLSIQFALGMLLNGTEGQTHQEILQTLNFPNIAEEEVNQHYFNLLNALPQLDSNVYVGIANSAWYDQSLPVKDDFSDRLRASYSAEVSTLNFRSPLTVDEINGWVRAKTNNKIEKIIDQISPQEVAFLINAIYFQGDWQFRFDPEKTRDKPFFLANGQATNVPMMHLEAEVNVFPAQEFVAFELPYGSGAYAMTIILPYEGNSLDQVLGQLDQLTWADIQAGLEARGEEVIFPRIELSYENELSELLKQMGMERVFTDQAEMSRMSDLSLFVNRVIHKTYLKVDEKGTEAAAVTGIGVGLTALPPKPLLTCDRPFAFFISEKVGGNILFAGLLRDPS